MAYLRRVILRLFVWLDTNSAGLTPKNLLSFAAIGPLMLRGPCSRSYRDTKSPTRSNWPECRIFNKFNSTLRTASKGYRPK